MENIEQPLSEKTSLPCFIVKNFLRYTECQEYIKKADDIGFELATNDYPPSYRNNERIILDSEELSERMTEKLTITMEKLKLMEFKKDGFDCKLKMVNSRFRLCRYQPGQEFRIHQDGVHYRSKYVKSILTFMIYLNEEFEDGHTIFFTSGPSTNPPVELGRYKPKCGDLIIFDHALWHSGEIVTSGIKYVMRSDIIYETFPQIDPSNSLHSNISHNGYVWKMIQVGKENSLIASGGRDTTINVFNSSLKLCFNLEGHTKSVLGLSNMGNSSMISISRDRSIKVWNLDTRECIFTKEKAHSHTGLCIETDPSNRSIIASGGADSLIKIWKFEDGNLDLIKELLGHQGWIWSLSWIVIGDCKRLVSASEDGSIRIWNIFDSSEEGELVDKLQHPLRCVSTSSHRTDCGMVNTIISVGDTEGNLHLYHYLNNCVSKRTEFKNLHRASIRIVHFISHRLLVTGSEDCTVKLWKLDTTIEDHPKLLPLYISNHENFVTDCLYLHTKADSLNTNTCKEQVILDKEDNEIVFLSSSYDGAIKKHQAQVPAVLLLCHNKQI